LTETEVVEPPGKTMVYNNYNPLLLGLILERATGRPVTTYLQEKIWTPIGMEFDASWSLDSEKSSFEKMESGINARAVDFAKLGRLYMNGGEWDGRQVVPADWVALSTQDNSLLSKDDPISYGYMWWGVRCNPQDFFALGDHGQFVYVSPARQLIIVRNGEEYGLPGEFVPWAETFCRLGKASAIPRIRSKGLTWHSSPLSIASAWLQDLLLAVFSLADPHWAVPADVPQPVSRPPRWMTRRPPASLRAGPGPGAWRHIVGQAEQSAPAQIQTRQISNILVHLPGSDPPAQCPSDKSLRLTHLPWRRRHGVGAAALLEVYESHSKPPLRNSVYFSSPMAEPWRSSVRTRKQRWTGVLQTDARLGMRL
jgi:hypothetical protein